MYLYISKALIPLQLWIIFSTTLFEQTPPCRCCLVPKVPSQPDLDSKACTHLSLRAHGSKSPRYFSDISISVHIYLHGPLCQPAHQKAALPFNILTPLCTMMLPPYFMISPFYGEFLLHHSHSQPKLFPLENK